MLELKNDGRSHYSNHIVFKWSRLLPQGLFRWKNVLEKNHLLHKSVRVPIVRTSHLFWWSLIKKFAAILLTASIWSISVWMRQCIFGILPLQAACYHQQRGKGFLTSSSRLSINKTKRIGPRTLPCGSPLCTRRFFWHFPVDLDQLWTVTQESLLTHWRMELLIP